jgi:hypothetical protein
MGRKMNQGARSGGKEDDVRRLAIEKSLMLRKHTRPVSEKEIEAPRKKGRP